MTFVILGWDGPNAQTLRPQHRPAHLIRLKELEKQGRLVCAGPFSDKTGSLVIIEADTQQEAESFAQSDPYVQHGIFDRIEVHPFSKVLPETLIREMDEE